MLQMQLFVITIALLAASPLIASADDAAAGNTFVADSDRVVQLLHVLTQGVDECFNPKHADANAKVKENFLALADMVGEYRNAAANGTALDAASAAADLAKSRASYDEKSPFPASLACATNRKCLEIGFEGDSGHKNCLPVNGDKHANPQYVGFEDFLDRALPKLIQDLRAL